MELKEFTTAQKDKIVSDFIQKLVYSATQMVKQHLEYRFGQALYNSLDRNLKQRIVGTEYDPFYSDAKVKKFLERVVYLKYEELDR